MLTLTAIVVLLHAHWVADFVTQTSWMANNKATVQKALLAHVLVYSAAFSAIAALPLLHISGWYVLPVLGFLVVNCIAHYMVDMYSSRLTKSLWDVRDNHNFFVVVGADQMTHYIVMAFSFTMFFPELVV